MAWKQSRERNIRLKKRCKGPFMPLTRGVFYNEEKGRCIHYYVGSRSKFLRKVSNKKVRRYNKLYANYSGYRKIYDYWYEMF